MVSWAIDIRESVAIQYVLHRNWKFINIGSLHDAGSPRFYLFSIHVTETNERATHKIARRKFSKKLTIE